MRNQLLLINLIFFNSSLLAQSILGIDVANHQGTINWSQVSAAGKVFAFVKATEGFTYDDPKFITNMTNGNNAGVKMGAYHFARPLNNSAINEANHFVSVAGAYIGAGYLPPVLDLEDDPTPLPNGTPLPISGLSTWVQTWMTTVENATGVAPILYTNSYYASQLSSSLNSYKLWIANPNTSPTNPPTNIGNWTTWAFKQYSWTGSVSGISGDVDLDVFNGTATEFNSLIMSGSTSPDLTKISDNMLASGNSVTFTVTVKNIGYATAGASSLGFLASVNSNLTFPSTLGANTIPALAPGSSYTVTRTINLCDAAMVLNSGTYYVGFRVDRLEEIAESEENNNVFVWGSNPVTIDCSTGGGTGTGSIRASLFPSAAVSSGAQWRVDGGAWTATNQTISNVTAGNHTVSFKDVPTWNTPPSYSFTLASGENKNISSPETEYTKTYILTTSSNPSIGGSTTGGGDFMVGSSGINTQITATPNPGWQLDNWTENGIVQMDYDEMVTITVSNDRNLVANFSQIIFYTITTTPSPSDCGFASGTGTLPAGSNLNIVASPKPNSTFINWTENGVFFSNQPQVLITVNGNKNFVANFACTIGVNDINLSEKIKIAPNPTVEGFSIITEESIQIVESEIFNMIGQRVALTQFINTPYFVPTINLFAGSYIVKLRIKGGDIITKKLIVNR